MSELHLSWLYTFANKDLAKEWITLCKKETTIRYATRVNNDALAEQSWSLQRQVSSLSVSLGLTFNA